MVWKDLMKAPLPWCLLAFGLHALACGGSATTPPPSVLVAPAPPRETPAPSARPPTIAVAGEPPAPTPVAAGECEPFANLRERQERDLTVPALPRPIDPGFFGRMRHHAHGSLSLGDERVWFGPRVPKFVPLYEGSSELHLLEPSGDDFVAVYRDPYGAGSCALRDKQNCRVLVVGYERCGKRTFSRDLREVMSRPTHLEVQDVRVASGVVYFNEACQSYSREAGGQCSALVALDPSSGQIAWRTKPLVSNNRLLVVGDYVVAGYGFTAEPDHVSLVRRRDGVVTSKAPLANAHEDLVVEGDELIVRTYPGDKFERFTLTGMNGDAAKLVRRK
jgi:hypothetical protein